MRRFKRARKRWLSELRRPLAWLASRLLPGSWTRGRLFYIWEKNGLQVSRVHYYSPFPDTRALSEEVFAPRNPPEGLDFRVPEQLALLERLTGAYRPEWSELPLDRVDDPSQFYFDNSSFRAVDAEMLYGLLRDLKPRRMIEIGSGHSTRLSAQALRANAEEGDPCEFVAIEPYPDAKLRRALEAGLGGLSKVLGERVEDVPMSTFAELAAGDVLFIDSTHIVRTGGDVVFEFLEVLPRLAPGVLVHVHDIFLPDEYPRAWLKENAMFFNEQYLLQAFLCHNDRFEIVWTSHYMARCYPDRLREAFPSFETGRWPGGASFWIRRRA